MKSRLKTRPNSRHGQLSTELNGFDSYFTSTRNNDKLPLSGQKCMSPTHCRIYLNTNLIIFNHSQVSISVGFWSTLPRFPECYNFIPTPAPPSALFVTLGLLVCYVGFPLVISFHHAKVSPPPYLILNRHLPQRYS